MQTNYTLSTIFICPLINDDYSGLEDGDHIMLEDFLTDIDSGYWTIESGSNRNDLKRCEITRLLSSTIEMTLNT